MKILHTADIHLRSVDDLRWRALERLLRLAEDESVDLMVVCGDLFDRQKDVPALKAPLRDLFHRRSMSIVIVPGNHDVSAIREGDYFGDNVALITRADHFVDIGDVRVFGLPFEKIEGDRVIEKLLRIRQQTRPDATNILLYHGELLDMVRARDGFGDEDLAAYMPARLSYFDGLGLDYVLAGHFHTGFEVRRFHDGYFVYPGSPVSITRKECGPRRVNVFETGGEPLPLALDTPFYDDVLIKLNPFDGQHPVETVKRRLASCQANARILLNVSGFVDLQALGLDERELHQQIGELMTPDVEEMKQLWTDVAVVLQSGLFETCLQRLEKLELSRDQAERVRNRIIEGMMENLHAA